MGLRYHKRVNIGNGYGLNLSQCGISSSYRSKYGSVWPRGFSIRTGIPGLTFRSSFGKSKKGDGAIISIIVLLLIGAAILTALLVWNIALFLKWSTEEIHKLLVRKQKEYKIKKEIELNKNSNKIKYFAFTQDYFTIENQITESSIEALLTENGTEIKKGDELAIIGIGQNQATLTSDENGKITFYKTPGEKLKVREYIYKLEK